MTPTVSQPGGDLAQRPVDALIAALCSQLAAQREQIAALETLALSREEDNAILRTMLSQAHTLLHTREQSEARRSGRAVLLLDELPHVRASIAAGLLEQAQRLRDERLEHAA